MADYVPHCDMVYIKLVDLHGHWSVMCHWRQLCCNHRLKLHSRVCLLWESFQYVFIICFIFAVVDTVLISHSSCVKQGQWGAESIAWDVFLFSGAFEFSLHQHHIEPCTFFLMLRRTEVWVCIRERKTLQNSSASLWCYDKKTWSQNEALKICANPYRYTQIPTVIVMIIMHLIAVWVKCLHTSIQEWKRKGETRV